VCAPPDECHEFGACDLTLVACLNPEKPDGEPCSGGTCQGGACVASPHDAGPDAGATGGGVVHGGCGCEVIGGRGPRREGALAALVGLLLLARSRRPRAAARAAR
jgi:MYXO-CTERM domain-containing protein